MHDFLQPDRAPRRKLIRYAGYDRFDRENEECDEAQMMACLENVVAEIRRRQGETDDGFVLFNIDWISQFCAISDHWARKLRLALLDDPRIEHRISGMRITRYRVKRG